MNIYDTIVAQSTAYGERAIAIIRITGKDAIKISRKIKALYPRANTTYRGKNLKIIKIKVLNNEEINNGK